MKKYLLAFTILILVTLVAFFISARFAGSSRDLPEVAIREFGPEQNLNCFDAPGPDFVIRSQAEADALQATRSPRIYCKDAVVPTVDFSRELLLGRRVSVDACSAEFARKVYRDEQKRRLVYDITPQKNGTCATPIINLNWVAVPATPDFVVTFKVN